MSTTASQFQHTMEHTDGAAPAPTPKGICALYNTGNTCYLNSALQVLRTIPEWAVYSSHKHADATDPLLAAYVKLTTDMNTVATPTRCKPSQFLHVLREKVRDTVYEEFALNVPHDAHEFIMYLLDKLGEAIHAGMSAADIEQLNARECPEWREATKKDVNPLLALTHGLDTITCRCDRCGTESVRHEVFNSLKIGGGDDVDDGTFEKYLASDRAPIHLDDYACEGPCNSRQAATIRRDFKRLPRILFATVDRYATAHLKASHVISLPPTVTLHGDTYCPIGIIDHHGSLHGGHYTAQVMDRHTGTWYFYDDEFAQKIDAPRYGPSTYIICLRRIIPPSPSASPCAPS